MAIYIVVANQNKINAILVLLLKYNPNNTVAVGEYFITITTKLQIVRKCSNEDLGLLF